MFLWLKDENNRGALLAIVTVLTTVGGGGWFVYETFLRPEVPEETSSAASQQVTIGDGSSGNVQQVGEAETVIQATGNATVIVGITLEQHEASLDKREAELRVEFATASAEERASLAAQIAEIEQQKSDIDASYLKAKEDLRLLRVELDSFKGDVPREKLEAAQTALYQGDRSMADALLAEVEQMESGAVERAAKAAYTRGEIAEQEIRWHDAAAHYKRAARLDPSFKTLRQSWDFYWKLGEYSKAAAEAKLLETAALLEFGENTEQHAIAISTRAVSERNLGHYEEAEPLYLQAIEIDKASIGEAHPNYATDLNNLAGLYKSMGRLEEAEPLYKQAIEIDKASIGETHPGYATDLNNLAGLYVSMGRYDEAEPLFLQARDIRKEALGRRHIDYGNSLWWIAELYSKIDGAVKSRFLMRVGWVIIVHVYFTRPTDRRIV